jgi:hypothetical protein
MNKEDPDRSLTPPLDTVEGQPSKPRELPNSTLTVSVEGVNSTSTISDVSNQTIVFLSTASPEQLAIVAVGGVGLLYLFLGRLGLLVVGVLLGVVGHATFGASSQMEMNRVSQWISSQRNDTSGSLKAREVDFSSLPPETAKAFEELTEAAMSNYVRYP